MLDRLADPAQAERAQRAAVALLGADLRADLGDDEAAHSDAAPAPTGSVAGAPEPTLAVPKTLIAQEAQNMMQRMGAELQQQGMKAEDIKLAPDMFNASAEERVALSLVVQEVVRLHGLQAKPEQVKALLLEAAQTYEQPEAVVRWHYEKPERLNEFEALAVERNVVDWIITQAQVQDVPVAFAELMAPARK